MERMYGLNNNRNLKQLQDMYTTILNLIQSSGLIEFDGPILWESAYH